MHMHANFQVSQSPLKKKKKADLLMQSCWFFWHQFTFICKAVQFHIINGDIMC